MGPVPVLVIVAPAPSRPNSAPAPVYAPASATGNVSSLAPAFALFLQFSTMLQCS